LDKNVCFVMWLYFVQCDIYRPNNNNLVKMQQLLELLVVLLVFLVYGCLISRLYLGTFLWFSGDYLVGPYFKLWLIKKKSNCTKDDFICNRFDLPIFLFFLSPFGWVWSYISQPYSCFSFLTINNTFGVLHMIISLLVSKYLRFSNSHNEIFSL
jgi:hypothetical protein